MTGRIEFVINGNPYSREVDSQRRLLWVLRIDLGLTGAKYGCGEGLCGACTVLVDGMAAPSCILPVSSVAGKEVITIEGLAVEGALHPLQEAFLEHQALQCGFCTPGMILGAVCLLGRNGQPTVSEIKEEMNRFLCRCGAHARIIQAIQTAAMRMRERLP